jgi:hypothetical protein
MTYPDQFGVGLRRSSRSTSHLNGIAWGDPVVEALAQPEVGRTALAPAACSYSYSTSSPRLAIKLYLSRQTLLSPCRRTPDGGHRAALHSTRNRRGQQCRDAFSDRCAPATRGSNSDQGDHRGVFPQVNSGVVGLAGLEPAASSLSAKCREPLCYTPFPQVTLDRNGRSYVLSSRPVMCSPHASWDVPLAAFFFLA